MYKGYSLIAIIPARCGSKGLPDKNIKILNGKPLMSWSIETALKCNYIDEVMVSTDSEEYAKIARRFGANVPFIRPAKYATDTASRKDLIKSPISGSRDAVGSSNNKTFGSLIKDLAKLALFFCPDESSPVILFNISLNLSFDVK